jgi:hypothetical protein
VPARHFVAIIATFAALNLTACGPRDRAYDPSQFTISGPVAPAGVIVPAQTRAAPFRGVYVDSADSLGCCWIAPHAIVSLLKPSESDRLVAGIWVPDIPLFARGQRFVFTFPGGQRVLTGVIKPGSSQTLRLNLPKDLARLHGRIELRLDAAVDYVPAREHVNGDNRHFAAVLSYMYFT